MHCRFIFVGQREYYSHLQTTLLINITFFCNAEGSTVCEVNVYSSADRSHDALFVEHCMRQHVKHYKQRFKDMQLPELKQHTVFSDGAPGHFKQKYNLYHISRLLPRLVALHHCLLVALHQCLLVALHRYDCVSESLCYAVGILVIMASNCAGASLHRAMGTLLPSQEITSLFLCIGKALGMA